MTMTDADKMLEWKNDPETRKFAIATQDEIKKEEHYKWLADNLAYFQVIQGSNNTIGAVRIKDNEVSIWIDRTFRGQGIAAYILEQISEPGMIAKIVEGNISSMKAFIKAGFKPINRIATNLPAYYTFKR